MISTLTVALSTFNDREVRAMEISKNHHEFFHIYYMKDGVKRVMLVPKRCDDLETLQREIGTLLSRSEQTQHEHGCNDNV